MSLWGEPQLSGPVSGFYGATERKYMHKFPFRDTFGTKETILVVKDENQKDLFMA